MSDRADKLAQELRDAFANRALIYAETFAELRGELGAKAAAELLGRPFIAAARMWRASCSRGLHRVTQRQWPSAFCP